MAGLIAITSSCGHPGVQRPTSPEARKSMPAHRENTISFVELYTTDMKTTQSFYSEVFGWRFKSYGPEYADIQGAGLPGGFAVVPERAPAGGALVVLYTTDLEACQERINNHGGRITKATFPFPGGRRFHFEDPIGNQLAVWSDK
jgi:predicted enzyme related to lactoylglutathione lyase